MKIYKLIFKVLLFSALTTNLFAQTKENKNKIKEPTGQNNVAYKWSEIAVIATGNDTERFKPRPTVTSRFLGLTFVAVFDAWSRYDQKAVPVYLKDTERRPNIEQTLKNKEIAISYAAYNALCEYYFSDKDMFVAFMVKLGLDPNDKSLDPNTR